MRWHRLARLYGIPTPHLKRMLTYEEFLSELAYDEIFVGGEERMDWRFAQFMALFASANGCKNVKPQEFLLKFKDKDEKSFVSAKDLKARLVMAGKKGSIIREAR